MLQKFQKKEKKVEKGLDKVYINIVVSINPLCDNPVGEERAGRRSALKAQVMGEALKIFGKSLAGNRKHREGEKN